MNSDSLIIAKTQGSILIVNFNRTELDMLDAEGLNDEFNALIDQGKKFFVLNFGNVKFISTSIMVSLIHLQKKLGEVKGEMNICCLSDHIRKVFSLTRLDRIFNIYDNESAAVGAFKP